jgi:hypothetical protein
MKKPHRYLCRLYVWLVVDVRLPRWLHPVLEATLGAAVRSLYRMGY